MTNLKLISTPFAFHSKLSDEQSPKIVEKQHYMDDFSYANLIDSIMYFIVYTHLA